MHQQQSDFAGYLKELQSKTVERLRRAQISFNETGTPRIIPRTFSSGNRISKGLSRGFVSIAKALDHSGGRLLLFGDEESGKTVSLLDFTLQAINECNKNPDAPLPVYAEISTWDYQAGESIGVWLHREAGAPGNIEELLTQGRIVLILDGLDYLVPEQFHAGDPQAAFLGGLPKNNSLILSCREHILQFLEMAFPVNNDIQIDGVSAAQFEQFVATYYSKDGFSLSSKTTSTKPLSPFLLSLWTETYNGTEKKLVAFFDISSEALLIRDTIETRLSKSNGKLRVDPYTAICNIAQAIIMKGPFERQRISRAETEDILGEQASYFLSFFTKAYLLLENRKGEYHFSNKLFLAHLGYEWCVRNLSSASRGRGDKAIAYMLHKADMMRGKDEVQLKREFAKVCANLLQSESEPTDELMGAIFTLSEISEEAKDIYGTLVKSQDPRIRYNAVFSLSLNPQSFAVPIFKEALGDKDSRVARWAIEGLSKLGDPESINLLIDLLSHQDNEKAFSAAEALVLAEDIDREVVLGRLIEVSGSKPEEKNDLSETFRLLHDAVGAALVGVAAEPDDLLRLARSFPEPSGQQFWLLSLIGKKYPHQLLSLLDSQEVEDRRFGAFLLIEAGDSEAVEPLIESLLDEDGITSIYSLVALSKMGQPLVPYLVNRIFEIEIDNFLNGEPFDMLMVKIEEVAELEHSVERILPSVLLSIVGQEPAGIRRLIDGLSEENEGKRRLVAAALLAMRGVAFPYLRVAAESLTDIAIEEVRELDRLQKRLFGEGFIEE